MSGDEESFDYLHFKLTVLHGVRDMYQAYYERMRKLLLTESTNALREILYSVHGDSNHSDSTQETFLSTPPLSPSGQNRSRREHNQSRRERDTDIFEEEILVHMVPIPISPVQDVEDLFRPAYTHRYRHSAHRHSHSLTSVISDMTDVRDL